MDRTMLFWTLALFFGSSIAFRAIQDATEGSPFLVTFGLEAALMAVAIVVIVVVYRRTRDSDSDDS